jgi:hypothetical protein
MREKSQVKSTNFKTSSSKLHAIFTHIPQFCQEENHSLGWYSKRLKSQLIMSSRTFENPTKFSKQSLSQSSKKWMS